MQPKILLFCIRLLTAIENVDTDSNFSNIQGHLKISKIIIFFIVAVIKYPVI